MSQEHSKKLKNLAQKAAIEMAEKFPEIEGISLSGSIVEEGADEFSDIDLDLWLNEKEYSEWINDCPLMNYFKEFNIVRETPTNFSFLVGKDFKFDLTLLSLEKVRREEWKIEQKASRKNSLLFHDPNNLIRQILEDKLKVSKIDFKTKEDYSVTLPNSREYYCFYISAYLNYHTPVALARKEFEQAHINLNWAMNLLLDLIWVENNVFYPYMKSKWVAAKKYLDEEQYQKLKQVMVLESYNEEEIKNRRAALRELYQKLGYKEILFFHEKVDLS